MSSRRFAAIGLLVFLGCCLGCPSHQASQPREAIVVGSSMGPNFLGAHASAKCLQCGIDFVAGFLNDEHAPKSLTQFQSDYLVCPNCGNRSDQHATTSIDGDRVQVIAGKLPQRWSVVAFERSSNEGDSTVVERGIKRVGGLPGETISIERGNLYLVLDDQQQAGDADAPNSKSAKQLLRKDYHDQLATAILVHDSAFDDGTDRWPIGPPDSNSNIRFGTAPFVWRTFEPRPCYTFFGPTKDQGIEDSYGCNQSLGRNLNRMDEVWVSFELGPQPPESLVVEFDISGKQYQAVFDLNASTFTFIDSNGRKKSADNQPRSWSSRTPARRIDVSSIDQQILVAINREPIFKTNILPGTKEVACHPVRFGIPQTNASFNQSFRQVRLFRDLYYLPPAAVVNANGELENRNLDAGSGFLLLGDNVPVSFDSRHWESPGIDQSAILGVVERLRQ